MITENRNHSVSCRKVTAQSHDPDILFFFQKYDRLQLSEYISSSCTHTHRVHNESEPPIRRSLHYVEHAYFSEERIPAFLSFYLLNYWCQLHTPNQITACHARPSPCPYVSRSRFTFHVHTHTHAHTRIATTLMGPSVKLTFSAFFFGSQSSFRRPGIVRSICIYLILRSASDKW